VREKRLGQKKQNAWVLGRGGVGGGGVGGGGGKREHSYRVEVLKRNPTKKGHQKNTSVCVSERGKPSD